MHAVRHGCAYGTQDRSHFLAQLCNEHRAMAFTGVRDQCSRSAGVKKEKSEEKALQRQSRGFQRAFLNHWKVKEEDIVDDNSDNEDGVDPRPVEFLSGYLVRKVKLWISMF